MTQPLDADIARRLDDVVDRALAEQRIVGATVLVAEDGRPAYSRSAGYADRSSGRPVDDQTIFRLASLTKPMITAAALAMVDDGALSLDDVVTRWLPDFRPKL